MTNWRTNLGGALAVTGTALIGVGVVPQLAGLPSRTLTVLAVVGFILSAAGKGLTALFAADASTVNNIAANVDKINRLGPSQLAGPATSKPE